MLNFKPIYTEDTNDTKDVKNMPLLFDLENTTETTDTQGSHNSFIKVLMSSDTKWFKTSWFGLMVYIVVLCLDYTIGYNGIYLTNGWMTEVHHSWRIFGDMVTVGWFALGMVSLPWHQWEALTCIKTKSWAGVGRFMAWWSGTILTFFIYGAMGQNPLFQSSLASTTLTPDQKASYTVVFAVIGTLGIYWSAKLCPCGPVIKRCCNPDTSRKVIFVRLLVLVTFLFVGSYLSCPSDSTCTYHLHHWWFGFVLILLSSASLDNWFDYFLQGVFWTFLIESVFEYNVEIGAFFK